jgi:pyruvate kinase
LNIAHSNTETSATWALERIEQELAALHLDILEAERLSANRLNSVVRSRRACARNLIHYVAMRQRDLRPLQAQLAARGLSSLGRSESQVLPAVETVLAVVHRLAGSEPHPTVDAELVSSGVDSERLLKTNTEALLGPPPGARDVRIMVTMPSEAAHDYTVVRDLVASGMDCMRINAAHDDASVWHRMIDHLDRARQDLARPCRVLVDVAGPKPRTGPVRGGPPVVRWRPGRDEYGRVTRPARIWLAPLEHAGVEPRPGTVVLPVPGSWLSQLHIGDVIKLFDARDSMRELHVVERVGAGVWCESRQTAYVMPHTALHLTRATPCRVAEVGELPSDSGTLRLMSGDTLVLRADIAEGAPATRGDDGTVLQPPTIGLTLPAILDDVRPGESIWLDDGRIGGVIRTVEPGRVTVAITHTKPGGASLAADKGINLPDSVLRLPSLTAKDRDDLRALDGRADLIGYSFVRSPEDVEALQSYLASITTRQPGIVLKIETRRAFERLPDLLIAAMRSPSSGVMIARGDLAVECGYERLAEVQEEILWMAEASHTPVIWATQVLEQLAKDGLPSRAEVTDAAMSSRAECVMLNKGPYIVETVRTLEDILTRMQGHQHKKRAMLRSLALARRFLAAR